MFECVCVCVCEKEREKELEERVAKRREWYGIRWGGVGV